MLVCPVGLNFNILNLLSLIITMALKSKIFFSFFPAEGIKLSWGEPRGGTL